MQVTRMLSVKLATDEVQAKKDQHYEVSRTLASYDEEKSAWLLDFRHRRKPVKDLEKVLRTAIDSQAEMREVACEERESLVNGAIEVVRLDTGEVIETRAADDDGDEDERQPNLFAGTVSPAPPAPALRCTVVNEDGEWFAINAEQADAADIEIAAQGFALIVIDGVSRRGTKIVRGKACETCGIVGDDHHPDCASIRAEDDSPDDGATVIAKMDGKLDDAPLVPKGDASKPLVATKPKRTRKANGAMEGAS